MVKEGVIKEEVAEKIKRSNIERFFQTDFGQEIIKHAEGVKVSAVFADRIVGKPYMLIDIKRDRLARYGISIEDVQEIHKTEPYVYSQTIAGRAARNYGEAKNSWLTGTASWTFVAASAHIVGVRAHYDGLEIDPVLPNEIDNVRVYRRFRDKDFDITIIKDSSKAGTMVINGDEVKTNIVKLSEVISNYEVICFV